MPERDFMEMVRSRVQELNTVVCSGLDPVWERLPAHLKRKSTYDALVEFCCGIVSHNHQDVAAYKPNRAFFAGFEWEGIAALREVIRFIKATTSAPVILDVKEGDIGKTNVGYIAEAFDFFGADAVTISPWLGYKNGLQPFFDQANKGIFVLCRTSNEGGADLQNRRVVLDKAEMIELFPDPDERSALNLTHTFGSGFHCFHMYEIVAALVRKWNKHGNCGLVVGATAPREAEKIRLRAPKLPMLVPGFGDQGGSAAEVVPIISTAEPFSFLANSSGAILYASKEPDYAPAAAQATLSFKNDLNQFRTMT